MNWRSRSLLIFFAGLFCGLIVTRVFFYRGLARPIRIASGSMFPTLQGTHLAVDCQDCGFPFSCDATTVPETGKAVCPNCGFPDNELGTRQFKLGDRVVIDRFPCLLRHARRWDLVAFPDPSATERNAVKRVIGLPGETISLQQGDLFVDGNISRKPLAVRRALAVLVHDDRFRPRTDNLPARWSGERDDDGWEPADDGYTYMPPIADARQISWLEYHNWRCFASPLPRADASPVLDHYGYNQNISRELHAVTDLTLTCRVRCSPDSTLWLRIDDGRGGAFEVELQPGQGTATLRRDSVVIDTIACWLPSNFVLEFGICDRQLLLQVDQQSVWQHDFEPSQRKRQPTSTPLAIGGQRGALQIDRLQLYRDVYYLDPNQFGQAWTIRLSAERREILVLGDNVPNSRDSRHWASPGVPHKSLLGKVLLPFQ